MRLNDTHLGFNGGWESGASLPGSPLFAEMRLHFARRSMSIRTLSNDYQLMPFSIGVRF